MGLPHPPLFDVSRAVRLAVLGELLAQCLFDFDVTRYLAVVDEKRAISSLLPAPSGRTEADLQAALRFFFGLSLPFSLPTPCQGISRLANLTIDAPRDQRGSLTVLAARHIHQLVPRVDAASDVEQRLAFQRQWIEPVRERLGAVEVPAWRVDLNRKLGQARVEDVLGLPEYVASGLSTMTAYRLSGYPDDAIVGAVRPGAPGRNTWRLVKMRLERALEASGEV